MKQNQTLTAREQLFLHWYALTGDAQAAAERCWLDPKKQQAAAALPETEAGRRYLGEIAAFAADGKRELSVQEGLQKLAFGAVNDAVRLMFADGDSLPEIDALDLYNVAELRRKSGGVEIAFFDRLQALDRLAARQKEQHREEATDFYEAVRLGAAALEEER